MLPRDMEVERMQGHTQHLEQNCEKPSGDGMFQVWGRVKLEALRPSEG